MSNFSLSVAEEAGAHRALLTFARSLGLVGDELRVTIAAIGSSVLGRLVGISDAHQSTTPLADALLRIPYETVAEALDDMDNLQTVGNDLLDGLFRDGRGSVVVAVAHEAGVATSAVGRLFPYIAPTFVAGLRSHVGRTGLSAEGLLNWIRVDLGQAAQADPEIEPVEQVNEPAEVDLLGSLMGSDEPEFAPESQTGFGDEFGLDPLVGEPPSFEAPATTGQPEPLEDEVDEPGLADILERLTTPAEAKPFPLDPESPLALPEDPTPGLESEGDWSSSLVVSDVNPDDEPAGDIGVADVGDEIDEAATVPEYRDIDHLREFGEKEESPEAADTGMPGLAWVWWIAGSCAIILLIALLLVLAGSS